MYFEEPTSPYRTAFRSEEEMNKHLSDYLYSMRNLIRVIGPANVWNKEDQDFFQKNPGRKCFIRKANGEDASWLPNFRVLWGFWPQIEAYIQTIKISENDLINLVVMPGQELVPIPNYRCDLIASDEEVYAFCDHLRRANHQIERNIRLLAEQYKAYRFKQVGR